MSAEIVCGADGVQRLALARAFAEAFQAVTPSDEQVAWFLDDAGCVIDDFQPPPDVWLIEMLAEPDEDGDDWLGGIDFWLRINGVAYVVQTAEKEPAHPVKLETYLSWIGGTQ